MGIQVASEERYEASASNVPHLAMAAYTVANDFNGKGLNTVWNYSGNRGSFLGTFHYEE